VTGFGVDVAAARADDLDKKLLGELQDHPEVSVLDLGCGAGGFAARLDNFKGMYLGVDQHDFSLHFKNTPNAIFVQKDIRDISSLLVGRQFDYCLAQRTIHYVKYQEAVQILSLLTKHVASLYISVSGLESDIGAHYPDAHKAVEVRFAQLDPTEQSTFSITEQLCLYTPEEAAGLLQMAGWEIEELWISAFGNIKAVATTCSPLV
jgi:SAM-dependent methyltransferase